MNKKATLALTLALAGALAFAPLAGCAGNQQSTSSAPASTAASTETSETSESSEQTAGGWTLNTEANAQLTAEEQEVFNKATAEHVGAKLTPVTVLATQVVSGTNYAYLCTSTPTTPDSGTTWCIVVVYQDLEGNASVTSVKDLVLDDLKVGEAAANAAELTGGWTVAQKEAAALPTDAQTAFDNALKNYDGMTLRPLALLGTQVVSGTNYLVLCEGAPVVQDPQEGLYVVTVYADLNGSATISDVQALDLASYVS